MSNQEEIVVSRRNLFLNSEDRNKDINSDVAYNGQTLTVPLQNLNIVAMDNQFIRVKLESFMAPNSFDNHAALDQVIYTYFGGDLIPKVNNGSPLPSAQLVHNYLTLPRYTSFTDVITDTANTVALNFQAAGFPTADWDYDFSGIAGQGTALFPAVERNGVTAPSAFSSSSVASKYEPVVAYDDIGYYSQSGYNGIAAYFTLTQNKTLYWGAENSGSFVPTLTSGSLVDNTASATAIQMTSFQDSDVYLQVGGRKGYTQQKDFPVGTTAQQGVAWATANWIAEATTAGTQNQLFNVTYNTVINGADAGSRATITVIIRTVFKMQLNINKMLFLRTNLSSTNYQSNNFNQRQSVQSSDELSASNILACFPMNTETIYYTNSGGNTWQMDIAQRTIPTLELFLTNKNNNELIKDNANPDIGTPNYNINFQCVLRIEVIERAVIQQGQEQQNGPGELPARFTSNVSTIQSHGNNFTRNSNFTRLAQRSGR